MIEIIGFVYSLLKKLYAHVCLKNGPYNHTNPYLFTNILVSESLWSKYLYASANFSVKFVNVFSTQSALSTDYHTYKECIAMCMQETI